MTDSTLQRLQALLGTATALLGATVLCGWLLQVRGLVEFKAGNVAMVFNTALCFLFAGSALALSGWLRRPLPKIQTAIGMFLLMLCGLSLTEQVFDRSFGIDGAFLHTWLSDGNTRLGRMAPNTAVGFMLTGATLILLVRIANKWQALAVKILTFSILAIGLTGLVGYSLAPDLLFGWARSARMAIHTAAGMVSVAGALWLNWWRADWYKSRNYFGEDEKISFMGAAILMVVTMTAGLTGFAFQKNVLEHSLKEKLHSTLKGRLSLLNAVVEQAATNTTNAASRPELMQNAQILFSRPDDLAARKEMGHMMNNFLHDGFRSLAFHDMSGRLLIRTEKMQSGAKASVSLPGSSATRLLWDGQFILHTEAPVVNDKVKLGTLVTEQALPRLHAELFDTSGLGETVEVGLCGGEETMIVCFPNGRNKDVYTVARQGTAGQALPMSLALTGLSGMVQTLDYRGKNVLAVYSPIAPGSGIVVKQETRELYTAIRQQFLEILPVLFTLAAAGMLFLWWQLKPLVTRLVISENKATEKELEIKALVGSVGEGILTMNEHGLIESFNPAASKIFGYASEEVIGRNLAMLMPPDMRSRHESGFQKYLSTGRSTILGKQGLELPGLDRNGTIFPLELTVNEIQLEGRRLFVGIVRDITERKRAEEKMTYLAQYDSLTGLPNRSLFMDRLSHALARASRSGIAMAVMFLDLDNFKRINDTMGHHIGDVLLKQFGSRLAEAVRQSDTVSRLGGDEFTIILEGLAEPEKITKMVGKKIIETMNAPFTLGDKQVLVTTSIGIAIEHGGSAKAANLNDLLRRADHAMYQAKNSGKNRYLVA